MPGSRCDRVVSDSVLHGTVLITNFSVVPISDLWTPQVNTTRPAQDKVFLSFMDQKLKFPIVTYGVVKCP